VADIVADTDAVADTVAPSAAAVVDMVASSSAAAAAADVVASSAAVADSVTSSAAVVADTVASPAAADMDRVDIHSVLMETETEEMMAQSQVLEPEVVEGEHRIRREDTEVVEEVGASSYSPLAWHYEMIVDVDVEKSLVELSWHVHSCEGSHDLWSHSNPQRLRTQRLCYLTPLQMMTLSTASGILTYSSKFS